MSYYSPMVIRTERADEHRALIKSFAIAGISITTIRIGDDTVNLQLLHRISRATGGQFYHVANAAALPRLLLQDTQKTMAQIPRRGEVFTPRIRMRNQVLSGIEESELPFLSGYAYVQAKPGAEVTLEVDVREESHPLLVQWNLGLGRVIAFTASPKIDSEAWMGWEGYGKFWSQLLHWVKREVTDESYALKVEGGEEGVELQVETFDHRSGGSVEAEIDGGGGGMLRVPLTRVAGSRYTGKIPKLAAGNYAINIRRTRKGGVTDHRTTIAIPNEGDIISEELATTEPNFTLLRGLAEETGGRFNAPQREIVERGVGDREVRTPLDWLLIPLVMLLFLIDIALSIARSERPIT